MHYKYGRIFLGKPHSASVNERPILNKIRQRITQLRAQLTPQDRGINVAPGILKRTIFRAQRRQLNSRSPRSSHSQPRDSSPNN